MITTNENKKALIQKLLDSKLITMEDAFVLLDEPQQIIIRDFTPIPFVQPYNPWQWPYTQPYYNGPITISMGAETLSAGSTTVCTGSTCNYTTVDIAVGLAKGSISYTSAIHN